MSLESNSNWKYPEEVKNVKDILDKLLEERKISSEDKGDFLDPDLENIPSWSKLYGTKDAAKQIVETVMQGGRIYIHGDFDVDGISATAILWEFLYRDLAKHLDKKVDVLPYIPDRVDEGYGLSKSSVDAMTSNGACLIITVDCGVRDRAIVEEYSANNPSCQFIITDHHQPPEDIKDAKYTIVHQMFPGKEYPEQKVCGAFVSFMLVQAIKAQVEMDDSINVNTQGLDLVALATVTDMMPLLGVNRTVVTHGLRQMKLGKRLGLKYLLEVSGAFHSDVDSYHLGFVIGPRINAAGRIGSAFDALKLLVSEDVNQVKELSSKLHNLNVLRQENTKGILDVAEKSVTDDMLQFLIGEDWHEGIIGLVAGKLLEKLGRPVVVVTKTEDGKYKGSARSISAFNITDAISGFSEHLERYGGHTQAAGFTIKPNQLEEFKEKLIKFANDNITPDLLIRDLSLDLQLSLSLVNERIFNEIEKLKPYGYGNPKPLLMFSKCEIVDKFIMKNGEHCKLKVKQGSILKQALLFNCLEDSENLNVGDVIDIAGYMTLNVWNGYRNIEIQVKEWRRSK